MMTRNPDGKLPVVTETNNECGGGCDRRVVLQGMAVASVVGACRIDVGPDEPDPVDAPVEDPGFELCGTGMLCVDLASPANMNLATPGGSRVIITGTTKILVGRTAADAFVTVSSVCTHAGCTVRYAMATNNITCPCHGSKYALDGSVTMGPAINPLRQFDNTFDSAAGILTIMLT
jgi:Rieske Fe-S protein